MIKIDKGTTPKEFKSSTIELAKEKLAEFYNSKNRSQKRYDFPHNQKVFKLLKDILHSRFHGKCAYCERRISPDILGVVEHFRPFNGIRDEKRYYADFYWWLVYDWLNILYSCKECGQYKANYFPIEGKRANSKDKNIEIEEPLIVNPCEDNPEDHLALSKNYTFQGKTKKGWQTIELLQLNRNSLVAGRKKKIDNLEEVIKLYLSNGKISSANKDFLNQIYNSSPEIEFLFTVRSVLLEKLEEHLLLQKEIEGYKEKKIQEKLPLNKKERKPKVFKPNYFPIEYIEIENFKSVTHLKIDFPDNDEQFGWLVFLGENGLGKSSILQAICLGLNPYLIDKNIDIVKFIQTGKSKASIKIKEKDTNNIVQTSLIRDTKKMEHEGIFSCPLIGYGSVRLLPNKILIPEEKQLGVRYKNLFNPSTPISSIFEWLVKVSSENKDLFNTVAYSLNQILPRQEDSNLTIRDNELFFIDIGKSFSSLSDGYKNTIALALDIMYSLYDGNTDMNKLTGIVLIDELGNQLHPRWQMQVVNQFRKVFPMVNFIVSTHHPLCLRGLKEGEVTVLRKDESGDLIAIQDLPNPSHLRVDQILTSPYFGLHSAVDPEIENLFEEYYDLLANDNLSEDEERRKLELSDKIPKLKFLGDNLREELAIYAVDKLIAENEKKLTSLNDLKEEAKKRVHEIWNSLDEIDQNDIYR